MKKFEQVSIDAHQVLLAGALYSEVPCLGLGPQVGGGGGSVQ